MIPHRIVLIAEDRSRYGDSGGLLPADRCPDDGLRRVFPDADYDDEELTPKNPPLLRLEPGYPEFVRHCIERLAPSARLWALGEVTDRDLTTLQRTRPSMLVTPSPPLYSAVMFYEQAAQANTDPPPFWFVYSNTESPYVYLFEGEVGAFERGLIALYEQASRDLTRILDLVRSFQREHSTRESIVACCREALFCVLPDGPHGFQPSVQSVQFDVDRISSVIEGVAREFGAEFTVQRNRGDYSRLT